MPKIKGSPRTRRRHFIREWRDYRGLTQGDLAEMIGQTIGAISQVEQRITPYNQDVLEAAARALECHPIDLIVRNPSDPPNPWALWDNLDAMGRAKALFMLETLQPDLGQGGRRNEILGGGTDAGALLTAKEEVEKSGKRGQPEKGRADGKAMGARRRIKRK